MLLSTGYNNDNDEDSGESNGVMMKMITMNVLTLDEWEIVGGHVVINRL